MLSGPLFAWYCGLSLQAIAGNIIEMNTCVVGLQWGDEGKGKIVDMLAENKDIVVRYNGGANAGHTVVVGDTTFALHLLPSGAIRPNIDCVIANGVVVDPQCLTTEIETLAGEGITLEKRLFISENVHLVLDYHKTEDRLREQSLGNDKLGTTVRGIGPCYADKVSRNYAVRMSDLTEPEKLPAKLRSIVDYKNKVFSAVYKAEPISFEQVYEKCRIYAEKFRDYITDTTRFLHKAISGGKSVLFEGAQGSLLDLDHGTFPFVTSSNSSPLGMSAGCGVPAKMVDEFLGVVKAYTTRVGSGPFPTEQDNQTGDYIRERGHEYGTTTGRPRRCGWFDAVGVLYSVTLGGIDSLALVHLDTLTGLKEIKVCTGYRINGKDTKFFPVNSDKLSEVECVYETMPGWDNNIRAIKEFNNLPENARNYVRLIEKKTGKPVTIVGVGPKRHQTIIR